MRQLSIGLLLLYAFAVPWERSLDVGEPFGSAARIVGVLLVAVVMCRLILRREMRPPGLLQWMVLGFYLYFVMSYFWTVDSETTVEKMRSYFQVMMPVWAVWEVAESGDNVRDLMRVFVAGCWISAALTVFNFSTSSATAEHIRFMAPGQDPNDVARMLDLGFPLAVLLCATEKRWWLRLAALGYVPIGLLGVVLTASRGGFFGAITALVGSAAMLVAFRPKAASVVFVALAGMAGGLWLFVPVASVDRLATIPQEVSGGDFNDRLNIWNAGWHAFTQAPWWGYGAGNFTTAAGLASGDTAHNTLMAVLVTGGLVGTGIFVGILLAVAWSVTRTSELLRISLITTLLVWGVTSMVGSVEENRATWLLFAVISLAGRVAVEKPHAIRCLFSSGDTVVSRRQGYGISQRI
jgi:O-antigen ligase